MTRKVLGAAMAMAFVLSLGPGGTVLAQTGAEYGNIVGGQKKVESPAPDKAAAPVVENQSKGGKAKGKTKIAHPKPYKPAPKGGKQKSPPQS